MSKLYQAEVEGKHLFDIAEADLNDLDQHGLPGGMFHILRNNVGYDIEVVSADYSKKVFVFKVRGRKIEVLLRDPVEVQVHEMGLDVMPSAVTGDVKAPMPGLVLSVHVEEGDQVEEGERLVILEAMKMENVLAATGAGTVTAVHVEAGQPVDKGQTLVTLE
jgi:biotin carboxyl carrier protein